MKATSRSLFIMLCLCFTVGLSACSSAPSAPASTTTSSPATDLPARLLDIQKAGKLVVGTAVSQPFEYHTSGSSDWAGFDVDLMTAIANRLNVKIDWKELETDRLLDELNAKNVDVVIAAMVITDERKQAVDMSQSYLGTGLVLAVRADDMTIQSPKDLANKALGVTGNAAGEAWAAQLQDQQNIPVQINRYDNTLDSLNDLYAGKLDAVVNDKLNTLEYIKTHPSVRIQGDTFNPAGLGIAVQKGDSDLLNLVNATISDMKKSGDMDKLFAQWFS